MDERGLDLDTMVQFNIFLTHVQIFGKLQFVKVKSLLRKDNLSVPIWENITCINSISKNKVYVF